MVPGNLVSGIFGALCAGGGGGESVQGRKGAREARWDRGAVREVGREGGMGTKAESTWDPWQASDYNKKSLVYQHGGCRVQTSGPWDPWLPVVKNSRLFAQRGHSAGTAHGAPPACVCRFCVV